MSGLRAGLDAAHVAALYRSCDNTKDEHDCSCTQTVYESALIVCVAIQPRRDEYPCTQDHVDPIEAVLSRACEASLNLHD